MTAKNQALKLRLEGQTYGEIRVVLGIPKSTQSGWFKNLKLSPETRRILKEKQTRGLVALDKFNTQRTSTIQRENESIRITFETRVKTLETKNLMLIGAALYWAEGYKNFNQKGSGYPYISFANSDPKMILIFLTFLEKILNINKNKIKGRILIHPHLSMEVALKFWQNLTKIPKKNLRAYRALSRASNGKRPRNLLPFGTFQIRVNSRREFFKIRGLIDGIIKAF